MTKDRNKSSPPISFLRVAKFSSALACGVMGGFLYSLKRVNPAVEIEVSAGSVLMAILGASLALAVWKFATELTNPSPSDQMAGGARRKVVPLIFAGGLMVTGMFAGYLYAIKDVRRAAFLEVLQGTTLALLVIGGIGVILVRLARMLNKNEPPTGSTGLPPRDQGDTKDPHG